MSKLHEVSAHGQSIWLDNLRRDLVSSGELERFMTEDAVTGVTSKSHDPGRGHLGLV